MEGEGEMCLVVGRLSADSCFCTTGIAQTTLEESDEEEDE